MKKNGLILILFLLFSSCGENASNLEVNDITRILSGEWELINQSCYNLDNKLILEAPPLEDSVNESIFITKSQSTHKLTNILSGSTQCIALITSEFSALLEDGSIQDGYGTLSFLKRIVTLDDSLNSCTAIENYDDTKSDEKLQPNGFSVSYIHGDQLANQKYFFIIEQLSSELILKIDSEKTVLSQPNSSQCFKVYKKKKPL